MIQLSGISNDVHLYARKSLSRVVPELHLLQKNPSEHDQITLLETENAELRKLITNSGRPDGFIGNSNVMHDLYHQIVRNTSENNHSLIIGEPGTEIDLVAQTLHTHSGMPDSHFVHLQCDSHEEKKLPMTTVMSCISSFRNGINKPDSPITLFIGDIDQLHILTIKELLSIIDNQHIENSNGSTTIRIIGSATSSAGKKVKESVQKKELLSRLYNYSIIIPPLRSRGSDILLFVNHYLKKYSVIHKKRLKSISPSAIEYLLNYQWPGNVKELELLVENAVKCTQKQVISEYDFRISLNNMHSGVRSHFEFSFDERVLLFEKELIINALKKVNGNQARAALHLKLTKRILQYKIEKYGIEFKKFKAPSI
jgi:Nif-specific regulatory protein